LNIQTEKLQNHTARLTVEVEVDQLEKAMRAAASRLGRRVNIPGFRKGKAPYQVLVNYLGQGNILEEAVETLGNEVYKNALGQAELEPYGPGSLENFELEPQPTFTFIVPLAPTTDLGDYRAIRLPYEAPVVDDEAVAQAMETLRRQRALIEESHQPVAAGNQVMIKVRAELLPEDSDSEAAEAEEAEAGEEAPAPANRVLIDRDDVPVTLTDEGEMMPGFSDALVGATVGEQRVFDLTYPDDAEKYPEMHGRVVRFDVTVNKVETVTLPELTDDFAARATEGEETPLSLLELRVRQRENLQQAADDQAKAEYATAVLEQLTSQAQVAYPEALLNDQIDHMLQHVDNDLRQRGLTLQDYMRISGKTLDDVRAEQREAAEQSIRRSLVLHELEHAERIEATEQDIDAEIERVVAQFGAQADAFRKMYKRREMRDNLRQELTGRLIMDRLVAIAKGEAPALAEARAEADKPSLDEELTETETE
jgi:trigger factor